MSAVIGKSCPPVRTPARIDCAPDQDVVRRLGIGVAIALHQDLAEVVIEAVRVFILEPGFDGPVAGDVEVSGRGDLGKTGGAIERRTVDAEFDQAARAARERGVDDLRGAPALPGPSTASSPKPNGMATLSKIFGPLDQLDRVVLRPQRSDRHSLGAQDAVRWDIQAGRDCRHGSAHDRVGAGVGRHDGNGGAVAIERGSLHRRRRGAGGVVTRPFE